MHIAYYFEPWIELGRPYLRYHNLRYQLGKQIERIARNAKDVKVSVIIGEGTYAKCQADGFHIPGAEFCVIRSEDLRKVFPDYATAANSLATKTHSEAQARTMIEILLRALGNKQPDIFVSFLSPAPFVESLWPDTLVLYAEFGVFSRLPFPRSFYFDAFGMFGQSYIARYAKELRALEPSPASRAGLTNLRKTILDQALRPNIPKRGIVKELTRRKYNVLLPLQFSGYFGFDTCCDYSSQYDFLIDVLNRISPEVGVVVTEHNGWDPVVTEHNEEFLRRQYPNFVSTTSLRSFTNLSQFLILECDAVASVSSSVGLQAAFWDKALIALGESHLNTFSAGSIEDLETILKTRQQGGFDGAIAHLLERYYVTENYAYKTKWSLDFYRKSLKIHRDRKKNFDFYSAIDGKKHVYQELRQSIRPTQFKNQIAEELKPKFKIGNLAKEAPHLERASNEFDAYDYVSFDVFDTLIQRPLVMPHQMFMLMQPEVQRIVADETFEFHKLRRLSEHLCRQETEYDEVCLDEIYAVLQRESGISSDSVKQLKALEYKWELRLCESRTAGRELFNLALAMEKKILIVSDFYMGSAQLRTILESEGYSNWAHLFVSSEHRLSKKSGLLYGKVLSDLSLSPKAIIHVGDNEHSDVEMAAKYGIASLRIPKGSDLFFANKAINRVWKQEEKRVNYPTADLHRSTAAALGLLINRQYSSPSGKDTNSAFGGNTEDLGYSIFGPIFLGFAIHLMNISKKNHNDHLMFLARDGSVFKRCYDILCKHTGSEIGSSYIYTSRRALSVATMFNEHDVFAALNIGFRPTTLERLLVNRFGLKKDDLDTSYLKNTGIDSYTEVVNVNGSALGLRKVVSNFMETILSNAKEERAAATAYFRAHFQKWTNPALVDIGYTGSLQRYLRRLIDVNPPCFFLLTHLKAKETLKAGTIIDGYLGNFIDHTEQLNPFNANISILEAVCSSGEASLERFRFSQDTVIPTLREPRFLPDRRGIFAQDIQKGALDFVDDFLSLFARDLDLFDFSPDFVTKWLFAFLSSPSHRDALIFNAVEHEDSYSGYEERFIVADVVAALRRGRGKLTQEVARALVNASDWKQGARAILPPKAEVNIEDRSLAPIEYLYLRPHSVGGEEARVSTDSLEWNIEISPPTKQKYTFKGIRSFSVIRSATIKLIRKGTKSILKGVNSKLLRSR